MDRHPGRQPAIGNRIRDLRIAAGLSQQQLAQPGYSDSYMSLIESGKRMPSAQVLQVLAGKLGTSAIYLRSGLDEASLADAKTRLRRARSLLETGQASEALGVFGNVLATENLAAFPDLVHQARRGKADALQACGHVEDAAAELDELASGLRGVDWEEWAHVQAALLGCRRACGDHQGGVEGAAEALHRLTAADAEFTDAAIELGVALAEAYLDNGDVLLARQLGVRLVRSAEAAGSPRARIAVYHVAAVIADADGDYGRGIELAERALAAVTPDTDIAALGRLRLIHARLLLKDRPDQAERAHALLTQHREGMTPTGSDDDASYVIELARAEIALGRPEAAVQLANDAIEVLGDSPGRTLAEAFAVLADAYARLGRHEPAIAALTRSAEQLQTARLPRQAAQTWVNLAELLRRSGVDAHQQAVAYRRALTSIGLAPAAMP